MTIKLWEGAVTDLMTRLNASLATNVTAVNAEFTSPLYPLDAPAQILDHIPMVSEMVSFPTIGVSDGFVEFQDDVGWGATGVMDFTIVCFLQSVDQRQLAWWCRRYATAIARTVLAGRTIGESWGVTLKNVRPGPTLGRDENPREWVTTVAVTITVKTEQDT